jgi:hypothetical protein
VKDCRYCHWYVTPEDAVAATMPGTASRFDTLMLTLPPAADVNKGSVTRMTLAELSTALEAESFVYTGGRELYRGSGLAKDSTMKPWGHTSTGIQFNNR